MTGALDDQAGRDLTLLDLVDRVLAKGVVLTGDVVLSVADVDLVYLRLSAFLSSVEGAVQRAQPAGARR